jgi:hypothetical protein
VVDRFLEGRTISGAIRGVDIDAQFDLATRERIERAVLDLLQGGSHTEAA